MLPIEVRLLLRHGGFDPLPLEGKRPVFSNWQRVLEVADPVIKAWSRNYPKAENTGILTRLTPGLDIDILNEPLVEAMERWVEDRAAEHGEVLVRIGRAPKRALLFRTDEPFAKLVVNFAAPDDPQGERSEKLEFLADGQQLVVHGKHPDTHKPYNWPKGSPKRRADLPYIREAEARELLDELTRLALEHGYRVKSGTAARPNGGEAGGDWATYVGNPADHDALVRYAFALVRSGMQGGAAVNLLRAQVSSLTGVDKERQQRRLREIPAMVSSAQEKLESLEQLKAPAAAPQPATAGSLAEVEAAFDQWLELEDKTPLYAALGSVAANLMPGDPIWLGLIAPPSSGKTEILRSLTLLPKVVEMTTVSPAGLLSGTPKKQVSGQAKGGLLRELGDFGILVLKDFGSVLSMRPEAKGEMIAALREIYDGAWVRHVGSEGGRKLEWKGKVGLIFGATEAYDTHHSVSGGLGERFLLCRVAPSTRQGARVLKRERSQDRRPALAQAVRNLFVGITLEPLALSELEQQRLLDITDLVVELRAHVERDRYSREIENVQRTEGSGRLVLTLQGLFDGLSCIGLERGSALKIVEQVALDSTPRLRRQALEQLTDKPQTTREIALRMNLPTTTTRRTLEDLVVKKLVARERAKDELGDEKGSGADRWAITPVWWDRILRIRQMVL